MFTPKRKKPQCQKCGSPMAGHKRPLGSPVCPNQTSPSPPPSSAKSKLFPPSSPAPSNDPYKDRRFEYDAQSSLIRYINRNFFDATTGPPPPVNITRQDARSQSWISTEPADDIPLPVKLEGHTEVIDADSYVNDAASVASISSVSSSSTVRIKRSITQLLSNSIPLASIFRTPKEDISAVTKVARSNGLYTALMHYPRPDASVTRVKAESSTSSSASSMSLTGQSSWCVVLGSDAGAVTHLADLHEKNAIGALEFGQTNGKAGTSPLHQVSPSPSPSPPSPPLSSTTPSISLRTMIALIVFFNFLGAYLMWFSLSAA